MTLNERSASALAEDGAVGPVWRRIATDLAADISGARYRAGESLPTALALAEHYGVHRHTVRQAFRFLQERGLVSVEQGRGTFVTGERLPYRLGRRVRLRENAHRAGIEIATDVHGAIEEVADAATAAALNLSPGAPVTTVRTGSASGDVSISLSVHTVGSERFPGFERAMRSAEGSFTAAMRGYGVADYLRLSTSLTVRLATEDETRKMGLAPGAPVLVSRAVDAALDNAPLHLVVTVFAGERVEFIVGDT